MKPPSAPVTVNPLDISIKVTSQANAVRWLCLKFLGCMGCQLWLRSTDRDFLGWAFLLFVFVQKLFGEQIIAGEEFGWSDFPSLPLLGNNFRLECVAGQFLLAAYDGHGLDDLIGQTLPPVDISK